MGFTALSCGCQAADTHGWDSVQIRNGLIDLQIVPEIGGRVLQYKLGDYGFFLVNEDLYDKKPPASGVGPEDTWLNYGGDKLWPAPQGWDNDEQWPGPPDPVLDGQPYTMETISPKEIRLTSGKDQRSGIQLSRVVKIFDGTTRVSIHATMKNIDTKTRRWGMWSHTQFNAKNRHGKGYNQNYHGYCPINPRSIFPKGYTVIFGLAQNPSYKPDYQEGIMDVHYQRLVGKIGMDSDAGWIATVDGTNGYVFVQRFTFQQGRQYPDNSSVEFWMDGHGQIYAYKKLMDMPEECGYGFESEIIGPYETLKPGESAALHYDWYSAKIPAGLGIVNCSDAGVVCEALTAVRKGTGLNITGKFGVFYEGTLKVSAFDKKHTEIKELASGINVSPLESLDLNLNIDNSIDLSKVEVISVSLFHKDEKLIGELANSLISAD